MSRLGLSIALLLLVGPAPTAFAATKEYSTGDVDIPISGRLERFLNVPDRGPVSFVRVSFRISAPRTADLAVSLVSPRGTEVALVARRGSGADFGSGAKGCGGQLTVLDRDMTTNPIAKGDSPFGDGPYRAEGRLSRLDGEEAHGRWALRIENAGAAATLHCLTLDVSRRVPETMTAARGSVKATFTVTERNFSYAGFRLKVVRRGRTVVDSRPAKLRCSACEYSRPTRLELVDLDGGEPEVLLELYTGGAHCCTITLVLGYDARQARYLARVADWGNHGYRLVDLDKDGLPEFSAFDERFAYAFTAYAFSAAPVQVWRYELHRFSDVTDELPGVIERDAAGLWKSYLKGRQERDGDVRGILAAYAADLYRLGRGEEAQRALQTALRRGDLGRGKEYLGWPAGAAYVEALIKSLREWGYIRP